MYHFSNNVIFFLVGITYKFKNAVTFQSVHCSDTENYRYSCIDLHSLAFNLVHNSETDLLLQKYSNYEGKENVIKFTRSCF